MLSVGLDRVEKLGIPIQSKDDQEDSFSFLF